jgi:hypothetical protein
VKLRSAIAVGAFAVLCTVVCDSAPSSHPRALCGVLKVVVPFQKLPNIFVGPEQADTTIFDSDVAPDESLWASESNAYRLVHISTSGKVNVVPIDDTSVTPGQVRVGPNGHVYFTEITPQDDDVPLPVIAERDLVGRVIVHKLPANAGPAGDIALGTVGNVWYSTAVYKPGPNGSKILDRSDVVVGNWKRDGTGWAKSIHADSSGPIHVDSLNRAWFTIFRGSQTFIVLAKPNGGIMATRAVSGSATISDLAGAMMPGVVAVAKRGASNVICNLRLASDQVSLSDCIGNPRPGGDVATIPGSQAYLVTGANAEDLVAVAPGFANVLIRSAVPIRTVLVGARHRVWLLERGTQGSSATSFTTGELCPAAG